MKLIKRILFVFTVIFLMLCTALFASAERTVVESGYCGEKKETLPWVLYDDGELVISGKGEIRDYFTGGAISSFSSNELIKIVTIEEGVTGIGEAVFYNCMNLEKVNISDTVKKIGDEAFSDCTSLKEVTIPDSVYTLLKKLLFQKIFFVLRFLLLAVVQAFLKLQFPTQLQKSVQMLL